MTVPPGTHQVTFRYHSYPYYWLLFLIGALTLVGLSVLPLPDQAPACANRPDEAR